MSLTDDDDDIGIMVRSVKYVTDTFMKVKEVSAKRWEYLLFIKYLESLFLVFLRFWF